MQTYVSTEHLKQLILSLLPDVLTTYFQEKEKELYAIPLLERLIRLEEELKALRLLEAERHQNLSREMDKRFEALLREMDKRFEAQQREMNARFEAQQREINDLKMLLQERHEALLREMDKRFEAQQKEMNARFEAQQKEMNARFEALLREMSARFEALEKRLNFMQWLIAIGFSFLTVLITLINFLK